MKEIDLAKKVIIYLENLNYDIYQEVQIGQGRRADIVAIQDNISWIIETKLSLSMKLLEQALIQRYHAHYISIAIPDKKINRVAEIFMHDYGIGGLKLINPKYSDWYIVEFCEPRLNRKIGHYNDIRKWVNDRHKYYAEAGNNMGEYWTPFKETTDEIYRYVKSNPGCSLKELIDNINHHYHSSASAKSSIARWIHRGVIKNISIKKNGKYIQLYYE